VLEEALRRVAARGDPLDRQGPAAARLLLGQQDQGLERIFRLERDQGENSMSVRVPGVDANAPPPRPACCRAAPCVGRGVRRRVALGPGIESPSCALKECTRRAMREKSIKINARRLCWYRAVYNCLSRSIMS
jgi:hypothetical protein